MTLGESLRRPPPEPLPPPWQEGDHTAAHAITLRFAVYTLPQPTVAVLTTGRKPRYWSGNIREGDVRHTSLKSCGEDTSETGVACATTESATTPRHRPGTHRKARLLQGVPTARVSLDTDSKVYPLLCCGLREILILRRVLKCHNGQLCTL